MPKDTWYLAASYGRRKEIQGYARRMRDEGIQVECSWLDGPEEDESGAPVLSRQRWAGSAIRDLGYCNQFVIFTPCTPRGGAWVEFGMSMERCCGLHIVGPRQNVFTYRPDVFQFNDFESFLRNIVPVLKDEEKEENENESA